jgi:hypothetical protein
LKEDVFFERILVFLRGNYMIIENSLPFALADGSIRKASKYGFSQKETQFRLKPI